MSHLLKTSQVAGFALLGLNFCVVGARAGESPAGRDCLAHFATEGSFLTGKKYTTWVALAGVSKVDAYSRVFTTISKDGWMVTSSDRESGIISAAQNVSFGKGSQAPMVIVVEPDPGGSKLTATFRTGGGQMAKEDTIKTKLCGYLEAGSNP